MTLDEEFAQLLDDLGLGTYSEDDGDIFVGFMPETGGEAIAVTEYPGTEPDSKLGWDEAKVQFRCRGGVDPTVSKRRALAIYDALQGLGRFELPGGTRLLLIVAMPPAPMGADSNRRHEHVVNVRATIRRLTQHRV